MGPDATPPESKAMAVYISGTKKDSTIAIIYPGTRNHKIDNPVKTRNAEIPIATAIAADRLSFIARPGIAPALTVSIYFSSMATAGSADIINQPSSADSGINKYFASDKAIAPPNCAPSEEKPTFTPVRKSTSPAYV